MRENPGVAVKVSRALKLARNRAIMDVLQIKPGPFEPGCPQGEEFEKYVQAKYKEHFSQQAFDKPENEGRRDAFLEAVALQEKHRGAFIIYHPHHAATWQEKIETTPLYRIGERVDKSIYLFTYEMENHFGAVSFNTQDVRYLAGILQERIYELKKGESSDEVEEKISRLNAGIVELREREQRLNEAPTDHSNTLISQKGQDTDNLRGLSLRQVALLYIYQERPKLESLVTARRLAEQAGLKSGALVLKHYSRLKTISERIRVDGRQTKHLINDIETVIPYLSGNQKKAAENEVFILRGKKVNLG
ncbi:hypothetical protein LRS06_09570 [Hymenobacter sp. J193]|uniref:hypothetical protein n=1 Tax=Hymenobacter sp. J193 TaxID=2898429 RepID=UPI002150ADA5|nr:hypothetical protein [Hymenobacter sp. J193]MCR5888018.1 hypothetical protein [Hymenobacter sp. J193]